MYIYIMFYIVTLVIVDLNEFTGLLAYRVHKSGCNTPIIIIIIVIIII